MEEITVDSRLFSECEDILCCVSRTGGKDFAIDCRFWDNAVGSFKERVVVIRLLVTVDNAKATIVLSCNVC